MFIPCFVKASEHNHIFPRCIQVLTKQTMWKMLSSVLILLVSQQAPVFYWFQNLRFSDNCSWYCHFCSCYEDYLATPFPLGLYKQIFLPPEMTVLPTSLGASTCIFSSDILHDEKVIDQVRVCLPYFNSLSAWPTIWHFTLSRDVNVYVFTIRAYLSIVIILHWAIFLFSSPLLASKSM